VQPHNQELLWQALSSDSSIVATAASDTLLRQAVWVLQYGSDSAKASAAEFCWLAAVAASENDAGMLLSEAAPVLATVLTQQEPEHRAVFALAALCRVRERLLAEERELPAVL
jgi:hypothetical protein